MILMMIKIQFLVAVLEEKNLKYLNQQSLHLDKRLRKQLIKKVPSLLNRKTVVCRE